ncbi:MAG: hypothetical protein M1269_05040 [Chloroflexi bacterium]|nr:hypothetical protein [Chloroflexota bacterium]
MVKSPMRILLSAIFIFSMFAGVNAAIEDNPLSICIIWNQHQPSYQDPLSGRILQPWARLHASKDYYQIAYFSMKYPKIHQTINLTPSLIVQLLEHGKGKKDPYLSVSELPAAALSVRDRKFVRENFFIVPRYARNGRLMALLKKHERREEYGEQDYRDLVTLFNLAWIDPEIAAGSPELTPVLKKKENFTEQEKEKVLRVQRRLVAQVISLHNRLQEMGRIELITTPFYHPILPLLIDTNCARRPQSGITMPKSRFRHPEDADTQVNRARSFHKRVFGTVPSGIWPSEQAVSPEVVPILCDNGFRWMVTDEKILQNTMGKKLREPRNLKGSKNVQLYVTGDAGPTLLHPELLYRPYRVTINGKSIVALFRDQYLSDLIGFEYSKYEGSKAALDFIRRLEEIDRQLKKSPGPHLVTIALDGENAWENYSGEKTEFLNSLFQRLSEHPRFRVITPSEFLKENRKLPALKKLATGSWNNGNLGRWIGTPSKNRVWDILESVRNDLVRIQEGKPESKKIKAWESLYASEGSDYPWWFDSTPYPDALPFDNIFRTHLRNVYLALGEKPPDYLVRPIVTPPAESEDKEEISLPGIPDFVMEDPVGDDYGPGTYTYPTDPSFKPYRDLLDLVRYEVFVVPDWMVMRLTFGDVKNPWYGPLGFSHPLINIYLSTGEEGGRTTTFEPGSNVKFSPRNPWNYFIRANGWPDTGQFLASAKGREYPYYVKTWSNPERKQVMVAVPLDIIGSPGGKTWNHYVMIGSMDGFSMNDYYREIGKNRSRWAGGGGDVNCPRVYDLLYKKRGIQEKVLSGYEPGTGGRKAVILPIPVPIP